MSKSSLTQQEIVIWKLGWGSIFGVEDSLFFEKWESEKLSDKIRNYSIKVKCKSEFG